ncbi:uncharacterized protein N7459_008735 [Penicillium hispanicum]|uniref:uncharacterized protein n=1 Tax=Penicillium hispanicum TaxID=1080232 RepID=UPI00253FCA28|nr:uncharacterized protein N7459_008735 [Penicillium hispanicum]KAJ5574308.1 hypothetical protein N7459_008735 [Penicillium hispanicum]
MSLLRPLLARILALILPLSITATVYLYLYPVFNGCAFPLPQSQNTQTDNGSVSVKIQQNAAVNTLLQHLRASDSSADIQPAIFRLLILADPQLEGDTSLPFPEWELIPRMRSHWRAVQEAVHDAPASTPLPLALISQDVISNITTGLWTLVSEDIPRSLWAAQKRIDLLGNDFYLAHIYRTLFWWTRPTHTTVLGDLLGSQWITDEEFAWRGQRFWTRVFKGGERVDDHLTRTGAVGNDAGDSDYKTTRLEPLGPGADPAWARRIINVAGNHDIGYAGDVSEARMERFEREFGRANWDIRFEHPPVSRPDASEGEATVTPTLHLINLNSLMLDTPALSPEIQTQTYGYLNDIISHRLHPVQDRSTFTLLLTHVPLHKEEGVCTDAPYFTFHDDDDEEGPDGVPRWLADGLREQNHLSDQISAVGILQGLFGMSGDENAPAGGHGRKGLILTGHDHTGCDAVHYVDRDARKTDETETQDENGPDQSSSQNWAWAARRYGVAHAETEAKDSPSIREVTLRSMMGEFGGNAGLLSIWFDADQGEWDYEITMCPAGVQHIWWAVHVLILVTLIVGLLWIVAGVVCGDKSRPDRKTQVSDKRVTEKGQLKRSSKGRP